MNDERQELLEIYKIHAALADKVSERREGANKLYVTLLTGMLIFVAAFVRYGTGIISPDNLLIVAGMIGIILSVSWYIVIRSYRQLNSGKFRALHELEEKLSYPFFKREWEFLDEGMRPTKYWRLTVVETILPIGFLLLSLYAFALGALSLGNNCV